MLFITAILEIAEKIVVLREILDGEGSAPLRRPLMTHGASHRAQSADFISCSRSAENGERQFFNSPSRFRVRGRQI